MIDVGANDEVSPNLLPRLFATKSPNPCLFDATFSSGNPSEVDGKTALKAVYIDTFSPNI